MARPFAQNRAEAASFREVARAPPLSVFVDSSMWFAAIVARDRNNSRAKTILQNTQEHITTDHVMVETWLLLNSRYRRDAAEQFWDRLRRGSAQVEPVTAADLQAAWMMGEIFANQDFSIVDRTSFAVMERLGVTRAASFDRDFAIYRYGRSRDKAFEVLR
jgi:predicted nucleic acid-binding protein